MLPVRLQSAAPKRREPHEEKFRCIANTATGPRFRYTGQQIIGDLGLYHYKARFYSPGLGRFLQTDPIGYKDDVNLYAYVGNNPANKTDPSGLIAREAKELAAGLGGAISSGWSASVAAFQNESLMDMALKTVEGLNPTVGAAAGAGVKLLGAADQIAYAAMGAVDGLGFTRSQLQHDFKHAKDFGVSGNANNKTLSEFSSALQSHVDATATRAVQGTYRGDPVTHHVDPSTGLNVIRDSSGNFLSGWQLSPQQLQHVLTTGKLGGG